MRKILIGFLSLIIAVTPLISAGQADANGDGQDPAVCFVNDVDCWQGVVARLEQVVQDQEQRVAALQNDIRDTIVLIGRLRNEALILKMELLNAKSELSLLLRSRRPSLVAILRAREKVAKLETELRRKVAEITAATERLASLRAERNAVLTMLNDLRGALRAAQEALRIAREWQVVQNGSLAVGHCADGAGPAVVSSGQTNVVLFDVCLTASNVEDIILDSIAFKINGANDVFNLRLIDADVNIELGRIAAVASQTPVATFELWERHPQIERGTVKRLRISADISPVAMSGDRFSVSIEQAQDVEAVGAASAVVVPIEGNFPVVGSEMLVN